MPKSEDSRPPMVVAMVWVHRLTSISIEMVLPAVLGMWADDRWGTGPWLLLLGTILGFTLAILHLVQIGQSVGGKPSRDPSGQPPSVPKTTGREPTQRGES